MLEPTRSKGFGEGPLARVLLPMLLDSVSKKLHHVMRCNHRKRATEMPTATGTGTVGIKSRFVSGIPLLWGRA
jgi:hypothetical protein